MISYEEFIKLMESREYVLRDNSPVDIYELSPWVKTFTVKKGSIGKFLEIECFDRMIISACGKKHPGKYDKLYYCTIKCIDNDGNEPFQRLHHSTPLTRNYHVVAEIIATKILQKEPNKEDKDINELSKYTEPILKLIKSENPCEYPMWSGAYKLFSRDFLDYSFNMYSNEKMILYIIRPDIDIEKVSLDMKADIFDLK